MKKTLPYILALLILVSILAPTHSVYATSWLDGWFPTASDLVGGILTTIFNPVLEVLSWILWLSGQLLDFVLSYTIIDMKTNIQNLTGINIAWKVIRDLMNIAFIFMLVYEGIILIIGQGSSARIKKFITGIVLASLLINFSLFFTKVLIDASNVVTIGFYKSILGKKASATVDVPLTGVSLNYGLSSPIIEKLNITSFWEKGAADVFSATGEGISGSVIRLAGAGAIILTASFIFFAVSIMFIIRYITLIILLMLSPIAYMGMALSFMSSYSKQWWETFKGQLLFGPIYMILTWVVLILMSSPGFIGKESFAKLFDNTVKPQPSSIGLLLNFALIIGLLIGSLIIAKNTSKQGSKLIGQATGKLSAFAGGAVFGGAARLSRNTVGRWGNATANDEELKDRVAKGTATTRERLTFAAANRAANSTFDARASRPFGTVAEATGLKNDFGKVDVKKENYRAMREEQEKAAAKRAERYKPSDAATENAKTEDVRANARFDENIKRSQEEVDKAKAEFKSATDQNKAQEEKIAKMQKDADEAKIPEMKQQILDNIKSEREGLEASKTRMSELEKLVQERNKAAEEAKSQKNAYKSKEEDVKAKYQERVNAEAARIAHSGENDTTPRAIWRYVANTAGVATNVMGITQMPMTRTDREAVGRKVRNAPKGKKKLTAKELKDVYGIESGDEEKKDEEKAEPKTEEEPPKTA